MSDSTASTTAAAPSNTYHHSENAEKYRQNANFVYSDANTAPVLRLLDAQAGEHILDVGCGSGELTAKIASLVGTTGSVVGTDVSEDMIRAAKAGMSSISTSGASLKLSYDIADGCSLSDWVQADSSRRAGQFDKVFSSAAMHWMIRAPERVVEGVWQALKPGGVFAAEMGGFMNVIGVRGHLHYVLKKYGVDPKTVDPWFFPTAAAYTKLLTSPKLPAPFTDISCELVPRPTPLPHGDRGLRSWLETFSGTFLNALPDDAARSQTISDLEEMMRPDMYDPSTDTWSLMYTRLRIRAVKPNTASPFTPIEAAQKIQSDFIDRVVYIHLPKPTPASASTTSTATATAEASSNSDDGNRRVFKGTFKCVDDGGNVVLSQADEWIVKEGSQAELPTEDRVVSSRHIGMVMIEGKDVEKIEVQVGQPEREAGVRGFPTNRDAYI